MGMGVLERRNDRAKGTGDIQVLGDVEGKN